MSKAPTDGDAVERGRDGHGEGCWYCGDRCNGFAGNPGLWLILLPLDDAKPGHCVAVHNHCVLDRLKRAGEVARAERAALLEKIREPSEELCRDLAIAWAPRSEGSFKDAAKRVCAALAAHLSGDRPK